MKTMIVVCLLLLVPWVSGCGQDNAPAAAAPDMHMTLKAEPEPLAVGEATLIITLTDAAGAPIDGASLKVHGDMDHQGMTPIDREVSDSTNGEYLVPFEWTMGGGWIVTVTASLPGDQGTATQTFELFVEAVSSGSIVNQPHGSMADATAEPDEDSQHSNMDMPES